MTEFNLAADAPVELSADEIAYVSGGNGLVGPGAGKDGGGG
ncbi:MAG TPA: hypothetical protein VEZ20_10505 [Allosphingosinicella sp.]|nr:hypothetical protein [Allosphingosinicella sp.]